MQNWLIVFPQISTNLGGKGSKVTKHLASNNSVNEEAVMRENKSRNVSFSVGGLAFFRVFFFLFFLGFFLFFCFLLKPGEGERFWFKFPRLPYPKPCRSILSHGRSVWGEGVETTDRNTALFFSHSLELELMLVCAGTGSIPGTREVEKRGKGIE